MNEWILPTIYVIGSYAFGFSFGWFMNSLHRYHKEKGKTQLDEAKVRVAIDKKITFLEYILKKNASETDKLVNQLGANVAIIQLELLKKELNMEGK